MTRWLLCVPLLLASCQLSPQVQEQIRILQEQADEAAAAALAAETSEQRLVELEREKSLLVSIERLKAEDYGRQTGFAWELIAASLGLGGFGVARSFGKSRATQELAAMRAKLEAFEAGMKQVPPVEPPTA